MNFNFISKIGRGVISYIKKIGDIFLFFIQTIICLFTNKIRIKELVKQMYSIGVMSLPVVLITGAFTGMVLAVQSFYQLKQFTLETAIATIVGLSMTRELGPVLTALMLSGRIGAAMSAELGTMKVTEQIDALESLSVNPVRYLVVNRFIACVVLTPILTIFSIFIGIVGGYFIGVKMLGVSSVFFINNLKSHVMVDDIFSGLMKAVFFGGVIAIVGCYKGFNAKHGAEGVGKATTESVVLSCIIILISDFFLSVILF
jgi:phospholipid/cholesterol/gamma-HCH transport system permease protein